jgi:hypothetical protein
MIFLDSDPVAIELLSALVDADEPGIISEV